MAQKEEEADDPTSPSSTNAPSKRADEGHVAAPPQPNASSSSPQVVEGQSSTTPPSHQQQIDDQQQQQQQQEGRQSQGGGGVINAKYSPALNGSRHNSTSQQNGDLSVSHQGSMSSETGSLAEAAQRFSTSDRGIVGASRSGTAEEFWDLYELTGRLLGFGGFALVYEGIALRDETWVDANWTFEVEKGQRVAIKVCTTRRVNAAQIKAEMDLMRQLQHPNVASVVDPRLYRFTGPLGGGHHFRGVWRKGSRFFPPPEDQWTANKKENLRCHERYFEEKDEIPYAMVMGFCDEGSLFDYIMAKDNRKPRSVNQAKRLFFDIICGLDYLSRKLMVHQDLKIDNVFLSSIRTRDGRPSYNEDGSLALVAKIGDMGLSRYVGGGRDSVPPWAELECVGREKCCHLSLDVRLGLRHPHYSDDIFSVGLAMFEFFTRERLKIESSQSLRKHLLAYMQSRPGWEFFQELWPLLCKLLHESRLLRPKLEDLILREPAFAERRDWLHEQVLQNQIKRGNRSSSNLQVHSQHSQQQQETDEIAATYDDTILSLGRRDEVECHLKGHPVPFFWKSRKACGEEEDETGKTHEHQPLTADFIFSDLRDVLVQSLAKCGDSKITLIVSASRVDWKTLTTRECSTCSAILEAESGGRGEVPGHQMVDMMEHRFQATNLRGENIIELKRRDGFEFQNIDRLFMGLFDRPRFMTREPFDVPKSYYSWRSLWSLYQGLRQSTHSIAPPNPSTPATVVLPLVGMVFRQETGPGIFSSDDNARKFVLQEIVGLLYHWASETSEEELSCVHVISWNQYDKHLILDGLHGLDGDQITTPTDLYQVITDALSSSPSIPNDEEVFPQLQVHLDSLANATSFAEVVKTCYEITTFLSTAYPVVVLNPSLDLASIHVNHSNARLEKSRSHCEVVKYNEHKRLYDVSRAEESIYIPMTGMMEGARSIVAVATLFHLVHQSIMRHHSQQQLSAAATAATRPPSPSGKKGRRSGGDDKDESSATGKCFECCLVS